MLIPHDTKRRLAAILGAVALFMCLGAQAANAASAPAASSQNSTHNWSASAVPLGIQWSPYDYSRITTKAKCDARAAYLRSVNSPEYRFTCFASWTQTCPSKEYWMVYIGTLYRAEAMPTSLRVTVHGASAAC